MKRIRFGLFSVFGLLLGALPSPSGSQDSAAKVVPELPIEVSPSDPKLAKIVLIAGSNYFKPGEHEYVAGCAVLEGICRRWPVGQLRVADRGLREGILLGMMREAGV